MCFPHSASSSCRSSSQRVARQVRMPLRALLTVWFESHHSHCQFITESQQLFLVTGWLTPTPNSNLVGLCWEPLHTLSSQVNDPHFTPISLLTSYTAGRGIPYLQGIGFSGVFCQADPPFWCTVTVPGQELNVNLVNAFKCLVFPLRMINLWSAISKGWKN